MRYQTPLQKQKAPRISARGRDQESLRQFSCCFPPPLNRMQLLQIFLRIAYDLSLRQTVHPQLVRNVSALAARADCPAVAQTGGMFLRGLLLPAAAGVHRKDLITGYNLGVNAFVQKPVDFEQFGEAIRHIGMFWMLVNQAPPPGVYTEGKAQGA
jgi:hypothetical protein